MLLATDIAARGLDIPAVHWVVHLDCPEDVETYVHRYVCRFVFSFVIILLFLSFSILV